MVPAARLDTFCSSHGLAAIDLLHMDVQGAEKDMILGGRQALSHTQYLFIETEDRVLYEGMAVKSELLAMLRDWKLIVDFGYNCLLENQNFTEAGPR